jgi:hypothetical protein
MVKKLNGKKTKIEIKYNDPSILNEFVYFVREYHIAASLQHWRNGKFYKIKIFIFSFLCKTNFFVIPSLSNEQICKNALFRYFSGKNDFILSRNSFFGNTPMLHGSSDFLHLWHSEKCKLVCHEQCLYCQTNDERLPKNQ